MQTSLPFLFSLLFDIPLLSFILLCGFPLYLYIPGRNRLINALSPQRNISNVTTLRSITIRDDPLLLLLLLVLLLLVLLLVLLLLLLPILLTFSLI